MTCPCTQNSGLGYLDAWADSGDSGDGGEAGIIAGIIAGLASIFGMGGDDQATSYKPPVDSAIRFISFNDKLGNEQVAYDATSAQSLQQGMANGNRLEDIYSYYSAFITGNVNSGASPAAAEVIRNTAAAQGVSIQRAADIILKVVGLIRQVKAIFTSPPPQTQPRPIPQPPVYTPPPVYSPQPIPQPYPTPPTFPGAQAGASNDWLWLLAIAAAVIVARRK